MRGFGLDDRNGDFRISQIEEGCSIAHKVFFVVLANLTIYKKKEGRAITVALPQNYLHIILLYRPLVFCFI